MDTKPWWQSKTIWGAVIATAATLLKLFKVNVELPPDLADQILNAVTLVGTIMAIIGRAKAATVISSAPAPINPNSPLMRVALVGGLLVIGFQLSGCTQGPVYPQSPAAIVGDDFQVAAHDALAAYADYKAGNVSLTWALQQMFSAYTDLAKAPTDVKALVAAWTGNTGDSQALADRLARIFGSSTAPPAAKMAALATAAGTIATAKTN